MNNNVYVTVQSSINSDGIWYPSVSIYYSGCDKLKKCKECQNPSLQQQEIGYEISTKNLIKEVNNILINWFDIYEKIALCFVGGEPLAEWNKQSVLEISKCFKEKYRSNICNIIYSWRYIEDLKDLQQYLTYIDYGVLGEFQIEHRDINYIPSSTNQYIYDFKNKTKIKPIRKDSYTNGNRNEQS